MGKPKGKTTAYAYFVMAQRQKFEETNPGEKIVFGEFMKESGFYEIFILVIRLITIECTLFEKVIFLRKFSVKL